MSVRSILRRYLGPDKHWYRTICRLFGFTPHNIELYKLALVHRSASVGVGNGVSVNNERLEYLGDAILEAVISDWLFIEFPDRDEGFLTQMRSKLVSRQSLNRLAVEIGLADHVIFNRSGQAQKDLYGDALEAMIGAIYLDKGYNFANRLLINRVFKRHCSLSEITSTEVDFKSRLIEWCQKNRNSIRFATAPSPGGFVARVIIDGIDVGFGEGGSKKEAEQAAACMLSGWMIPDSRSDRILTLTDQLCSQES